MLVYIYLLTIYLILTLTLLSFHPGPLSRTFSYLFDIISSATNCYLLPAFPNALRSKSLGMSLSLRSHRSLASFPSNCPVFCGRGRLSVGFILSVSVSLAVPVSFQRDFMI